MENTIRAVYHAVRRAGTKMDRNVVVRRATTFSDLRRAPVPRGMGKVRDEIARRLSELRAAPEPLPLKQRLWSHLTSVYTEVIRAKGGEVAIEEKDRTIPLTVKDRAEGMVLLGADGWRYYSRRFGSRRVSIRYLCGRDDNGRWAVRVPGNLDSVEAALEFIEPAEVKKARAEGRRVIRQGDVYFVEIARNNMRALEDTRHRWDAEARTLYHDDPTAPHGAVHVPFKAKAVKQSALRMGRRNGRARGD